MSYRVAVDVGGTFTDCAVVASSGRRAIGKALTTPGALEDGVLAAVGVAAERLGLSRAELLAQTSGFVHGTTQATNAILTRTGVPTGLITSRGHEDTLIIGRVYAKMAGLPERDVVHASRLHKPAPIVPRTLIRGVPERVDRDGDVIVGMDEAAVVAAIGELVEAGVEAIAVCFLWSFVNDAHERTVGSLLATHAPGVFVALSCDIAPVAGEYERVATTAMTAYVGPKVTRYLGTLERRLRGEGLAHPLLIMQASGGLTSVEDATRRPLVTLDSGPTGGVLGSRHLGSLMCEDDLICTDVGGTSFDVGLVLAGKVPLDAEPIVAQYSLRLPKVLVDSIGSGGGSVAWIDSAGLLRVGPQSAGSDPGPACYARGGHAATVTDADLVLGYLDREAFLGGRMRLDRDLAVAALDRLGQRLGMEPEEVALAIFQIINAQMADLIRRSTVEQGHDPRSCVVVAYGGAGPTHAVFYAREIGAKAIIVPADSTVFSAEGMLTCDLMHTAEVSRQVASPFSPAELRGIGARFQALEARVLEQFEREGTPRSQVVVSRSVGARFRHQVHGLEITVGEPPFDEAWAGSVVESFTDRYRQVYGEGAVLRGGGVEIELHRVVGTCAMPSLPAPSAVGSDVRPNSGRKADRAVYFAPSGFRQTAVYDGGALAAGQRIEGPAVIERMGDSVVLPPGFGATVDRQLSLRIVEDASSSSSGVGARGATGSLDPVTFEVIRHRLWAINDDQARMAARLSGSPIVFEGYDFNVALTTGEGKGLFCGLYILQHGATIDGFVERILHDWASDEIHEGDMFFTNDPWCGALHASDGILVMPILAEGRIVAWSGIVMHDADVGGPVPGSMVVTAPDRFAESPLFPPVKIVEAFRVRRDIEQIYLRNSRAPELNALNMHARIGALVATAERVVEIAADYGIDSLLETQARILSYVENLVAARLRGIPDGTWYAQGYLDNDGPSDRVYVIRCALTKTGGRLRIDFTGTSPQAPGPINCTRPAMEGAVMGVLLTFLCFDLPWAIGGLRNLVEIVAEEATLNNAADPAAVSTASVSATLSTQDVVAHAFAKMLLCSPSFRDEAQATWMPGFSGGFFTSVDRNGEHTLVAVSDMFSGGGGARTFADGVDSGGIMHSMASRMCNVETIESRAPLLQVYRRELRDGGGPGRFRGGAGVESAAIAHKNAAPALYMTFASGVAMPGGRGLAGGYPGAAASSVVLRGSGVREAFAAGRVPLERRELDPERVETLPAKAITPLGEGDLLISVTASGAGYGDPLRREPARVHADVISGLVSEHAARERYGIVLGAAGVDTDATERLREELRGRRRRSPNGSMAVTRAGGEAHALFPIGDAVELVEHDVQRVYRCTVCNGVLGDALADYKEHALMREIDVRELSPANEGCSAHYVLREYSCPGCGTAIATDVQERGEGRLPEIRLEDRVRDSRLAEHQRSEE